VYVKTSAFVISERNLNPKSACLKRREEEKGDGSSSEGEFTGYCSYSRLCVVIDCGHLQVIGCTSVYVLCLAGGGSGMPTLRANGTPISGSRSTIAYGVPTSNAPPNVQLTDYYGNPMIPPHRRSSENMVPPNVTIPKGGGGPMI